jgi:iron complex outermembrane recepter protein
VTMFGFKLNHEFSENLTYLSNSRHTDGESEQQNSYNYGLADADRTLVRSAYFTDESISGYVIDNQLQWTIKDAGSEHRLLVGVEYYTLDSTAQYGDTLANATPVLDLSKPNYDMFDVTNMPFNFYQELHDISQQQTGFYLQDEFTTGDLTLIAGLRLDSYESTDSAENEYAGTAYASETKIDQEETTRRLAAIYQLENGISPYLSYAESFEPTSGVDSLTGESFKPTLASQIEVGAKYASEDNRSHVTFAYFDLAKENVVVNTADFMQYTQTGEVTTKGIELWIKHQFNTSVDAQFNLTNMNVEVSKNSLNSALVGNTPIWVAEKQASIWFNYYPTDDWSVSGGYRYVGERQLDAENTSTIASYGLVDLAVRYHLATDTSIALTANNLTDKRYVGACYNANNCWMGAERNLELVWTTQFE